MTDTKKIDRKKYVYAVDGYTWGNASVALDYDDPGTLGITAGGRIEFTLPTGKVLFSAPLALTRAKANISTGSLFIVVGSRYYSISLFKGVSTNIRVSYGPPMGDAL